MPTTQGRFEEHVTHAKCHKDALQKKKAHGMAHGSSVHMPKGKKQKNMLNFFKPDIKKQLSNTNKEKTCSY
eukprot:12828583-Ditylum_brightwellii.AAC.1